MDTALLYQRDSYLRRFPAVVVDVRDDLNAVTLNQTAFYPAGGGQPNDTGVLEWGNKQSEVIRVQKSQDGVLHYIRKDQPIPSPDTRVEGILNWDHRYELMRTHTAMHILCGVIFRDYGAQVTGGDMEPLKGRMDFEFETLQKELIQEIEAAVNVEVKADRDIQVDVLPREEAFKIPDLIRTKINLLSAGIREVRVVNIVGLDLQADGGTHVRKTSEVGKIRVVDYKSKGKINKRIYIELDK